MARRLFLFFPLFALLAGCPLFPTKDECVTQGEALVVRACKNVDRAGAALTQLEAAVKAAEAAAKARE